ncbi:MAG TPA: universal stress protein [Burkholderiales bacterium]|nr:universal stress protein [Burkholderiales bacterium]
MASPSAPFSRLLLVTQGTKFDTGAEQVALAMATRGGVRLLAVFPVVSNPEYVTLAPELEQKAEVHAARILTELRREASQQNLEIETRVRLGEEPYIEVVDEASKQKIDLIVMRTRGKRGLMARLLVGENVAKVIGHARCSVLVVPRKAHMWKKRVLLATDGSRFSVAAAAVAGAMAKWYQLPVTVISVVTDSHIKEVRAEASDAIERALDMLRRERVTAAGKVVDGWPHEALIGAAEAFGADLIVVGSHGRTGLEKVVMGSTAERVIGLAKCPVLVVKHK